MASRAERNQAVAQQTAEGLTYDEQRFVDNFVLGWLSGVVPTAEWTKAHDAARRSVLERREPRHG